ncbi:hypothetical protein CONPUDRAFT_129112 [Coniophora puteana RWD-64-598 SS2]|uniref:Metallo-dependent hydrolase n=1 Tax=Coniophora puteana (strain RWD-64-598) TaxID=741705 RepID=A0A5M3MGJ8_CONPW|nr:uncharacterized protein CONPUDRAFT_129112 [Coniophora puteana RWD-64-598 SS2]EIW78060.1 hypothetical protein CONPUDRAFT_129112 [Coniophora puteana RWD-64-598 SS2]
MAKKTRPSRQHLITPQHSTASHIPIIDTHTHLHATFSWYTEWYLKHFPSKPNSLSPAANGAVDANQVPKYDTIHEFVQGVYEGKNVKAIVDVWCEAPPLLGEWRKLADSALTEEERRNKWGGIEYWFVMGVHPHNAGRYTDKIGQQIVEAMSHPRCVGWGEIGLDYARGPKNPDDPAEHEALAKRHAWQRKVFEKQLRLAVQCGKPLTIHTREAEEDTERIMKEVLSEHRDWRIHIHCFTDSPEFAQRLLDHFPNLHIGITGVVSYSSNLNTTALLRQMSSSSSSTASDSPDTIATSSDKDSRLRILLETDAPYMVPANIYKSLPDFKGRLPLCHTAMIPWTAEHVAGVVGFGDGEEQSGAEKIMRLANENAERVYGLTVV